MEIKNVYQHLSTSALVMITLACIASPIGMVIMAQYGTTSLFYYALVIILFFIPSAMACSELGSAFPEEGGMYNWTKIAFGKHIANIALWSQWLGIIFSFPVILSFSVSIFLYPIAPQLITHGSVILIGSFILLIASIGVSLISIKFLAKISYFASFAVSIVPITILIIIAMVWLLLGDKPLTPLHISKIMPNFHDLSTFSLLGATVFMFAGIEFAAVCQKYVKNPRVQYPRAVTISTIILIVLAILGTLSISILVSRAHTSLTAGLIQAIVSGSRIIHMSWLPYALAALITIGYVGVMSAYIVSLSKGLQASAKDGLLPKFLAKENARGIPQRIVILLGLIAAAISLTFIFLPTVGGAYWTIEAITAVGVIIHYLIIFAAVIYLRYKMPNVQRAIKIPGGKPGVWLVAGAGFFISLFAIMMTFVPPDQFNIGNPITFDLLLTAGASLFIILPVACVYFNKRWQQQQHI